jgi:hypothetical protein
MDPWRRIVEQTACEDELAGRGSDGSRGLTEFISDMSLARCRVWPQDHMLKDLKIACCGRNVGQTPTNCRIKTKTFDRNQGLLEIKNYSDTLADVVDC